MNQQHVGPQASWTAGDGGSVLRIEGDWRYGDGKFQFARVSISRRYVSGGVAPGPRSKPVIKLSLGCRANSVLTRSISAKSEAVLGFPAAPGYSRGANNADSERAQVGIGVGGVVVM
jgi:hypothetical protein